MNNMMMLRHPLYRSMLLRSAPAAQMVSTPVRNFRHVKNLHEVVYTTEMELHQRTAKYLERTDKVYKPSQTIEFNREGELLLFYCDNIKNSTIYFKYPYVLYDSLIPLGLYAFFFNPLGWNWQVTCSILYLTGGFAWIPHALYWKHLDKKIHKLFLLRGGKYVRIWTQNPMGDQHYSWASICDMNLLTEDYEDFAFPVEEEEFLSKTGQIKYEVQVQMDHYTDHAITIQDEIIYFMKEGKVHQPEIFEWVLKGYNIDTSDFVVNTENNVRYMEANHNH